MRRVLAASVVLVLLTAFGTALAAEKASVGSKTQGSTAARSEKGSLSRLVDHARTYALGQLLVVAASSTTPAPSTRRIQGQECSGTRRCLANWGGGGCWFDDQGTQHCPGDGDYNPNPMPCGPDVQDPGNGGGWGY